MDIRFVAKQYLDAGWAIVPLVKGEKRASTSWRTKTYAPADFGPEDGIALKCGEPSGHRVDVDLDCMEAVEAAKLLLPATGLIHGRPAKPFSHYWFICKDIKTTQFTDIKANGSLMIAEIRSTGGYTAVPPSVHPSGEVLHWESERSPIEIEPEVLYACVRDVALAALLAKHWETYGHHAIGPLAGFLTQAGVVEAVRVILTAAQVAGASPALQADARKFAETTVAKLRRGEKVTGGPTLKEHLPEAVIDKMRGWCKMADVDAIEEMNAKHFWVRMGKDDVVGREDSVSEGVVFQRPRSLYTEYVNRKIVVGTNEKGVPEIKPLFQAWLESTTRRSYSRVVFAPPPRTSADGEYNLWQGYAITPQAGDCHLFLEHLEHVICGGVDEHYQYLLKLLAMTCQQPGTPLGVATVMRGDIGAGKGTVMRVLEKIFGRKHFTQLDKVDQLAGHFNAAISGKVIVFADEAFWGGDKREVGALKRLITEPTLHIVRKGFDGVDEDNHIHLFMATNEEWSVPASKGERRFFAVNVSGERAKQQGYFNPLYAEIKHGGAEAFLDMMLKWPVTMADIRSVPRTQELRVQQAQSLSGELKWWNECLVSGKFEGSNLYWSPWITSDDMYTAYKTWTRDFGGRLLDRLEFARRVGHFIAEDAKTTPKRMQGRLERAWPVRDLSKARDYFDAKLETKTEWDDAPSATPNTPVPNPFLGAPGVLDEDLS